MMYSVCCHGQTVNTHKVLPVAPLDSGLVFVLYVDRHATRSMAGKALCKSRRTLMETGTRTFICSLP